MSKIFYLDDDPMRTRLDGMSLRSHEVTKATNYNGGLESIRQNHPFDLYILDGNFPRTSKEYDPKFLAHELIPEIRAIQKDARIVVQSSDRSYREQITSLDVIFKNKSDESVRDWLDEVLGGK